MDQYVTYYAFLSDNSKIIKDVHSDFVAEGYSGNDFDDVYRKFISKMVNRCSNFGYKTILGSSKLLANYAKDIRTTESEPQSSRFKTLLIITERYMRSLG